REAGRRLPGADPAQDRGVHIPPQQHLDDHRRAHDPDVEAGVERRVRRLARRRDADRVAHRDRRRGRSGRGPSGPARKDHVAGAGRTCFAFEVGKAKDGVRFELKLDMARQCWDEARHCEISAKLGDWMGTSIGEYAEGTILFEAACNADPVLRLAGVNRALEGLAIDVFNTMRDFGEATGDPVLEFCEDWMLADEVTHVKMGSDWLRRVTANDPERRKAALDFQR